MKTVRAHLAFDRCLGALALALLGSCTLLPKMASAQMAPLVKPKAPLPDLAPGERPPAQSLEAHIWAEADGKEKKERSLGDQNPDAHLTQLVVQVVHRVVRDYAKDVRVLVVDRPYSAAIMAPNGFLVVPSGLLLRVQTEDELAFLLGREFIHYKRRHFLQVLDNQKTVGSGLAMVSVVPGVGPVVGAVGLAGGVGELSRYVTDADHFMLSQRRYGYFKEQEQEADLLSLKLLPSAGYSIETGLRFWEGLLQEKAARTKDKSGIQMPNLPGYRIDEAYVQQVRTQLGQISPDPDFTAKRRAYRAKIRPHLATWFDMELKRKGFARVIGIAQTLQAEGEDLGYLTYIEAEAYRLRGRDTQKLEDVVKAGELYRAALKHKDCPSRAQVGLGTVEQQQGHTAEAISAFRAYLAAEPKAKDAWIIQDQIAALGGKVS